MGSFVSYLDNGNNPKKTTSVSSVNDTRTDIVNDIKKLKSVNNKTKFKNSVRVQPSSEVENVPTTDFDTDAIERAMTNTISDDELSVVSEAISGLTDPYDIYSTSASIYSKLLIENNDKYYELNRNSASAKTEISNTKKYVSDEISKIEKEIEELRNVSKYKKVDDAKKTMEASRNDYEETVTAYRTLEKEIDDVANNFEILLNTNQANYEKLESMKASKISMQSKIEQTKKEFGSQSIEYEKIIDEYVKLSDDIEQLSVTHAENVKKMNSTELKLKNMLDKKDNMKEDVDSKRKKYSDDTKAYESISMDDIEKAYEEIQKSISDKEASIINLNGLVKSAEDKYDDIMYQIELNRAENQELFDKGFTYAFMAADEKKKKEAIAAEALKLENEMTEKQKELEKAQYEATVAANKATSDKAKADAAKQEATTAKQLYESAKKDDAKKIAQAKATAKKTGKAQAVVVSAATAYSESAKKLVDSKNKQASTAAKKASDSSKAASSAQTKVTKIQNDINAIKDKQNTNKQASATSTVPDSSKLANSINNTNVESILVRINKNLSLPNPTDTLYSSLEKYSNYYNRFKKPDLTTILRNGFPHVYFVRPSCNILDSKFNLIKGLEANQDFAYAYKSANWLLRELVANNGQNHDFMLYPSWYASSFSLSDEYITTTSYGKNYVGDQIAIGQSNKESKTAGTFEIQFRDDKRLHMYQLHKLWVEYISNVYLGTIAPKTSDIKNKILDYTGAVYYIVTAEDNETIIFWSKYYGIFPTQIPSTQYSWGAGNNINDTNLSIQYQFSSKTDYNPKTIMEFNYNARCDPKTTSYVPIFDQEMNGAGRSIVGTPFISVEENDTSGCPYVLKLRHRKPDKDV